MTVHAAKWTGVLNTIARSHGIPTGIIQCCELFFDLFNDFVSSVIPRSRIALGIFEIAESVDCHQHLKR